MIDVGGMRAASHSSEASAGEISGSLAASRAIEIDRCSSEGDDECAESWSEEEEVCEPAVTGECEVDDEVEVDSDGDDVSDADGDVLDDEDDDGGGDDEPRDDACSCCWAGEGGGT
jgi:hypothetical protein